MSMSTTGTTWASGSGRLHHQTISIIVENRAGVLARISALFARRGFNIISLAVAPTDDDVWSTEFFTGATHVSEPERRAFNAVVDAQFADVVRPFTPGPGVYTYWDYTQLRFPKRQGMRIDFILASPALATRVTDAQIVRDERKGKAPSDHAPVLVDVKQS